MTYAATGRIAPGLLAAVFFAVPFGMAMAALGRRQWRGAGTLSAGDRAVVARAVHRGGAVTEARLAPAVIELARVVVAVQEREERQRGVPVAFGLVSLLLAVGFTVDGSTRQALVQWALVAFWGIGIAKVFPSVRARRVARARAAEAAARRVVELPCLVPTTASGAWQPAVVQDRVPVRLGVQEEQLVNAEQLDKIAKERGFIAALDQSGGSTPKALSQYGVDDSAYSNDAEMFDLMHAMRSRIITSKAFDGDRILGAILFEQTMDRQIEGTDTAEYLWSVKRVVPFVKVDKGLADEANGAQVMKAMPDLDDLLARARAKGVFGTKMRSVIKLADPAGVKAVVDQQFEVGEQILGAGLVPIIEPEIDIHSPQKAEAEELLRAALLAGVAGLSGDGPVMLKLTLPEQDDFYADLVAHPRVLKVVALSGGYSRDEANARLARNPGVVASFSRALTNGLSAQQSDDEFDAALDEAIGSIAAASRT
jgi:fructose-bisphosphate aldolase, class I